MNKNYMIQFTASTCAQVTPATNDPGRIGPLGTSDPGFVTEGNNKELLTYLLRTNGNGKGKHFKQAVVEAQVFLPGLKFTFHPGPQVEELVADRMDNLQCALKGEAAQILWDMRAEGVKASKDLILQLQARYGSTNQTALYRTQLKFCRCQKKKLWRSW